MASLRIRLILLLGIAIVTASATLFITSFQSAQSSSDRLFDYHMKQMALTIQNTGLEELGWDPSSHQDNQKFDLVIQIWNKEVARIYNSRTYRYLPKRAAPGFSNVTLDNGTWRVYAVQDDEQVIQVAQKMSARRENGISFALRTLWPIVPVTIFLLLATWWVVTAALRPLNRVSRELAERNAESHLPVDGTGLPNEVSPLIVELNSLLRRMTSALQSQQRFVADAAHELRSPITALKLQIHTLAKAKDEAARNQAISRLLMGIDRSSHLVAQLLALARHDPLSQPFNPAVFSLTDCVRQTMDDVAPLAMSRQIDLQYEENGEASIPGELEGIRILIRNLLDNAIRYIPESGLIKVAVHSSQTATTLIIQDSGSGIPSADRARVFDRFYRVPGTEQTGTGLGLAIVKAIADRHGAVIQLHDAEIGGLKIKVIFPSGC